MDRGYILGGSSFVGEYWPARPFVSGIEATIQELTKVTRMMQNGTYRHGRYRAWRAGRKMRWAVRTLASWPMVRRRIFQRDREMMRQARRVDANIDRLYAPGPIRFDLADQGVKAMLEAERQLDRVPWNED